MINQVLTKKFKDIVRYSPNFLYDTGALWKSIKVDLSMTDNTVIVYISCEDYIKYHVENYQLLYQFRLTKEFRDEVKKISMPFMFKQFNKFVMTGQEPKSLQIKILINQ